VPAFFAHSGPAASQRFIEFFTAEHYNANTRTAYATAVRQFAAWADAQGFQFSQLSRFTWLLTSNSSATA
jgi:hypothetical protein